jgi:hypothetical protein
MLANRAKPAQINVRRRVHMLDILRKTLALIFAGVFSYMTIALVLRGESILSFWQFQNEPVMLMNSLFAWLIMAVSPIFGAVMLYKNRKAGKIIFAIYFLFFAAGFVITLIDPDFFKS